MPNAKIPPISDDSLKIILEYVNLDTRVRIRHCIPKIQEIESLTPCHLDTFSIGTERPKSKFHYITVNNRKWVFNPHHMMFRYKGYGYYPVEQPPPDEAYKELAKKYLISGSHIQQFYLGDCPEGLFKTDPSFKLFIEEFIVLTTSELTELPSFISADHLKKITIPLDFSTVRLLINPVVTNVEHIHLWFNFGERFDVNTKVDIFLSLSSKIVSVVNREEVFESFKRMFEMMLDKWRGVGYKFIMEEVSIRRCYHLINNIATKHKELIYPTPDLGDVEASHAVAVSIDENSFVVVYAIKEKNTLVMEVMKK